MRQVSFAKFLPLLYVKKNGRLGLFTLPILFVYYFIFAIPIKESVDSKFTVSFALIQRVWHTYIIYKHNNTNTITGLKFIKVEPGNCPFRSLCGPQQCTPRETTHPTMTGICHSTHKCFCSSTCAHLATLDILIYTVVTVDNARYPSHHDDSHLTWKYLPCVSLAGT